MRIYSRKRSNRVQAGFTLLEMVIATVVLLIGTIGIAALFGIALTRTSSYGDKATRTAEYAQDKMEELLGQSFPTLTSGDGITPSSPPTGFYDYIGSGGSPTPDPSGALYMRRWQVVDTSTTLKTVTVKVHCMTAPLTPDFVLVSQRAKNF